MDNNIHFNGLVILCFSCDNPGFAPSTKGPMKSPEDWHSTRRGTSTWFVRFFPLTR